MSVAVMVWGAFLLSVGDGPMEEQQPSAAVRSAYKAAEKSLGNSAEEHLKLAVWCEANMLMAERAKHLDLAVRKDPDNSLARGLLGQISYGGRWVTQDEFKESVNKDEKFTKTLAGYHKRRAELLDSIAKNRDSLTRNEEAHKHVMLGQWCDSVGLKEEAKAHFYTAVLINPDNDANWKSLGYVKYAGRWMSREQVQAEEKEFLAQRKADRTWGHDIQLWRTWLNEPVRKANAFRHFDEIRDPRAVPTIVRLFFDNKKDHQLFGLRLLAQIESPAATRLIAEAAVLSPWDTVRTQATEALKGREPQDFAPLLVELIRDPMTYNVQPVAGAGSPGRLVVETPAFQMTRTYDAPPAFSFSSTFRGYVGYDANGLPVVASGRELDQLNREKQPIRAIAKIAEIEAKTAQALAAANLQALDSQQRLIADIAAIEDANAESAMIVSRVIPVLTEVVGAPSAELKTSEVGWKVWWHDKLGYRYYPPKQIQLAVNAAPKPYPPKIMSCFVAGTMVRTLEGHRPIETLVAGDQVLSQDCKTGTLSFQPIQYVHHNPPYKTVELNLDRGGRLVPSIYHRFWKVGVGWTLARDLKEGDVLRTLFGPSKIVSISPGFVQPLFNLDVAGNRTFFVGDQDALVHDNTLPDPHDTPFDALPDLKKVSATAN